MQLIVQLRGYKAPLNNNNNNNNNDNVVKIKVVKNGCKKGGYITPPNPLIIIIFIPPNPLIIIIIIIINPLIIIW